MGFLDSYRAERARLTASGGVTPIYQRQSAVPVQAPPEPVLLPAYCNLYREYELLVAERHGSQLKLIRSERVPPGFDGGAVPPPAGLGAFQLNAAIWTGCACCGAKSDPAYNIQSVWWCACERCDGTLLFQCMGNDGGVFRCANGTLMNMHAVNNHPAVAVQGWRVGATPQQASPIRREPPLSFAQPPVPQLAPPSATLRIGYRGRSP